MSAIETPWYIAAGCGLGAIIAVVVVLICCLILFDPDFKHVKGPLTNRRATIVMIIGGLAWWWLPWILYGVSLIPWSKVPMPPMPPKPEVTAEKLP